MLRGKGLSPLQKVCNFSNNKDDRGSSIDNINNNSHLRNEDFLKDYHKDDDDDHHFAEFMSTHYDNDDPMDCLSIGMSSKYCGSGSIDDSPVPPPQDESQITPDDSGNVYDQVNSVSSSDLLSLSLQQAERLQEMQREQPRHPPLPASMSALLTLHSNHISLADTLMAPHMPFSSDQVTRYPQDLPNSVPGGPIYQVCPLHGQPGNLRAVD